MAETDDCIDVHVIGSFAAYAINLGRLVDVLCMMYRPRTDSLQIVHVRRLDLNLQFRTGGHVPQPDLIVNVPNVKVSSIPRLDSKLAINHVPQSDLKTGIGKGGHAL